MWHGNEKLLYSRAVRKHPITAFSSQHKRFSKLDFLPAPGGWSRRKSRTPPPCVLGNSLAESVVLPGKCPLQISSSSSGLLILHQITKLDPTSKSQWSLARQAQLCPQLSSRQSPHALENLFSPGLNGHLCCYPWCSPFGKCINAELRTRQAWGWDGRTAHQRERCPVCPWTPEWTLPVFPPKNPVANGSESTCQSLRQREIRPEHLDISSKPPVLTNIHRNCYSPSYSMHNCFSKNHFHLPPPNLKL